MSLGIIGTGHFASYFVAALRRGGYQGSIALSPRNAIAAKRLASAHRCRIASSNQEVLDSCDAVLLSVRPPQAEKVLSELRWCERHLVLSAMAGIPLERLLGWMPNVETVHIIMPGSYIEAYPGPIPVYPPAPRLLRLLSCAGTVIGLPNESAFQAAIVSVCCATFVYELAASIESELKIHGLKPQEARQLALGNIAGAAEFALSNPEIALSSIADGIATEGTFNKLGLDRMRARDFASAWTESIALMVGELRKADCPVAPVGGLVKPRASS